MIEIQHFTDPGCPWAWSASPHLSVLHWRYGDQLRWRLVMIGLTERAEQYVQRGYTPLDSALGRGNFGINVARIQADLGLSPQTTSSDVTLTGRVRGVGLLDSMAKFMSLGYSLQDVVRMASTNAARAIGLQDQVGAIAVGREADLSIVDVVTGRWKFTDTKEVPFTGDKALVPVQTVRAGVLFSPDWGPYPWGWLPEEA